MNRKVLLSNLILLMFTAFICLAACGINDGNRVGDCTLTVSFDSVPDEFYSLDEKLIDSFYICVVIENIVTEKNYNIILDQDNGFGYTAYLYPGSYHLKNIYAYNAGVIGVDLKSDTESFELVRDNEQRLNITIANKDEFIRSSDLMSHSGEMAGLDKFSRLIMTGDTIYALEDLKDVLNLTVPSDQTVIKAYSKEEYTDDAKGITITLLNDTPAEKEYKDCRVIAVEITKRNCVLPGCVAVGVPGEYVCNAVTGVYGQPHSFEGMALYGYSYGNTDCVYCDANTGDRITVSIDDVGRFVSKIKYEMERYE